MKVKNIMFSGVMASILMIGGAYADNTNLTTVDFVVAGIKSGINASKNYTDSKVGTVANGTTVVEMIGAKANSTDVYTKGAADTAMAGAITTALNDGGAIKAAIADATSGLATSQNITDLQSSVSSLQSTVNGNGETTFGLAGDVAALQELVGTDSVSDQIEAEISGLNLSNTYAGKTDFETLAAAVNDEDTGLATKVDAADVATAISTAVASGDIKDALDGKQDKLQVTGAAANLVGDGYVSVTQDSQTGKITVALDSTQIAGAAAWDDDLLQ